MKKLLFPLMPIALIAGLFFILQNTDRLPSVATPNSPEEPSQPGQSSSSSDETSPYITTSPLDREDFEAAPKAIIVEDDEISAPSYLPTEYPFVNQPYKWKPKRAWSYKYNFSFNSDGSVSQNFLPRSESYNLQWWPNRRYSIILSNDKDWKVDIVFNSTYTKFTARRRGHKEVFTGKRSR